MQKKIQKKGLRRGLAVATTLILAFLLIVLFSSFIIPKIGESISLIIQNIFSYANSLVTLINDTLVKFHLHYEINYDFISEIIDSLNLNNLLSSQKDVIGTAGLQLLFQSFGLFGVFINAITSFIMSIYMLANKETHIRQLKKIITYIFGYKRCFIYFST